MNSVGGSMQALMVCHCWHWLRVFPLEMPNGCRLCQVRDGSRRRAVVFPCLWSQKVDSAGEPGKIRSWEHFLICSLSRALTRPCCKTSAVCFHLDQRAQPQFQACKHSETSAAESMIFPPRIFQVDILKQTPLCCRPHPWPLELWPLCIHICAGLRKITKNGLLNREKMSTKILSHVCLRLLVSSYSR